MKKTAIFCVTVLALSTAGFGVVDTPFVAKDKTARTSFRVVPARSLTKVPRECSLNNLWTAWKTDKIKLDSARDETESFQLVIIPGNNGLQRVSVKPGKLRNEASTIPIECNFVEYVRTIKPKNTRPTYVGWWPDILMPNRSFDVPAGRQQPVWLRVNVPPDAVPGRYDGKVVITGDGVSVSVPVTLRVRTFRIPRPGTLACPFGLYPGTIKKWYGIVDKQNPSVCPISVFKKWSEFLGKYRLTPKNIGREYWKTSPEGKKDLSRLRKTVGALRKKYYPPYSFAIYRLPNPGRVMKGEDKKDINKWISDTKQGFAEYKRLGFSQKVFLYGMDEASEKYYPLVKETYTKIKAALPEVRIMQTLNHAPPEKLVGLVDIWCPLSPRLEEKYDFYKARQKAGDMLWMYVCCVPCETYANFFIDEPAIDHRMLFWQAWQKGVTGLLYWSTTWWEGLNGAASGKPHFPDVPVYMRDTVVAQKLKNNGDGLLIWPGPDATPYPSIRLEIIRDGIEDYEYMAILKGCIQSADKLPVKSQRLRKTLKQARALTVVTPEISRRFSSFSHNPEVLLNRREKIADMIEHLKSVVSENK